MLERVLEQGRALGRRTSWKWSSGHDCQTTVMPSGAGSQAEGGAAHKAEGRESLVVPSGRGGGCVGDQDRAR